MSKRKLLIKLLIFVILPLFTQVTNVESKTEAKKGRGKAFGAGILAGGLAGAAMGHILTRANNPTEVHHHHHHHTVEANAPTSNNVPAGTPNVMPPQTRPSTIIERGETLENGCYKEIIKEPNEFDITRFIETEQLICPPNVSLQTVVPPIVPVQSMAPVQPVNAAGNVVESNHAQPQTPADMPTNIEHGYTVPLISPRFNHDGASLGPVVPQPLPQPPVLQPEPVVPISGTVPNPSVPVQVITLSRKTGFYAADNNKKNNSASNVFATKMVLLLLVAGLVHMF